jgi:hypothetical protein
MQEIVLSEYKDVRIYEFFILSPVVPRSILHGRDTRKYLITYSVLAALLCIGACDIARMLDSA